MNRSKKMKCEKLHNIINKIFELFYDIANIVAFIR